MTNVLFVCLGNICRSPMAEVMFKKMVQDDNLQNKIHVSSAAISVEEQGNPPHPGAVAELAKHGLSVGNKTSSRSPKRNLTNRITSSAWIIKTSIISTGWPRLQIDERFFFAIILFLARKELIFRILGLITNSIEHTGNCRKPCQNGWIKLKHN